MTVSRDIITDQSRVALRDLSRPVPRRLTIPPVFTLFFSLVFFIYFSLPLSLFIYYYYSFFSFHFSPPLSLNPNFSSLFFFNGRCFSGRAPCRLRRQGELFPSVRPFRGSHFHWRDPMSSTPFAFDSLRRPSSAPLRDGAIATAIAVFCLYDVTS